MMGPAPADYNETVFGMCWRGAAVLLLACSCWLGLGARASAAQQIAVGPNPWLDVQLQSGTLTVNTWDRPDVQIASSGQLDVKHVGAAEADPRIPHQYTAWSQSVSTGNGDARLPEESFVLPQLQGSSHDAVVADGRGNTTITVPRGTALVTARVGTGQLNMNGYHGAFITQVRDGGISFNHVDGSGYAEALRGPIQATDSTFDRLRGAYRDRQHVLPRLHLAPNRGDQQVRIDRLRQRQIPAGAGALRVRARQRRGWACAAPRRSARTAEPDTSFRVFTTVRRQRGTATARRKRFTAAVRS